MSIVDKILGSFAAGEVVLYGNAFNLNTILEEVKIGSGGIVMVQEITTSRLLWQPAQHMWQEQTDVLMFFLTLSTYDRDSVGNENLVDTCRRRFIRWLLQFPNNNALRPVGDVRIERVYEKTDTCLTGIAAAVTLQEEIGTNYCNINV